MLMHLDIVIYGDVGNVESKRKQELETSINLMEIDGNIMEIITK